MDTHVPMPPMSFSKNTVLGFFFPFLKHTTTQFTSLIWIPLLETHNLSVLFPIPKLYSIFVFLGICTHDTFLSHSCATHCTVFSLFFPFLILTNTLLHYLRPCLASLIYTHTPPDPFSSLYTNSRLFPPFSKWTHTIYASNFHLQNTVLSLFFPFLNHTSTQLHYTRPSFGFLS